MGEWLMMRKDLHQHECTLSIASMLSLEPDAVVGKLLRVWAWARERTANGIVHGASASTIDLISGVKGFGEAMMAARNADGLPWLEYKGDSLVFPRWDKWLSNGAKARALDTAKKSRTRMGHQRDISGTLAGQNRDSNGTEAGQQRDKSGTTTGQNRDNDGTEGGSLSRFCPAPSISISSSYSSSSSSSTSSTPSSESSSKKNTTGKESAAKSRAEKVWEVCTWKKVGKEAGLKAIMNAERRVASERFNGDLVAASEYLRSRAAAYAVCRLVQTTESRFLPHPSTWFNAGRYDDDPREWDRARSGSDADNVPIGGSTLDVMLDKLQVEKDDGKTRSRRDGRLFGQNVPEVEGDT